MASSPLTRSSYHAGDDFARLLPNSDNPVVSEFLARHAAEGAKVGEGRRTPDIGSRAAELLNNVSSDVLMVRGAKR